MLGLALLVLTLACGWHACSGARLTTRAWNIDPLRGVGNAHREKSAGNPENAAEEIKWAEYPEMNAIKGKGDSGIALSGGGVRAYLSSLGYLRGLLDLGLLEKTRYISSVSGGSWANSAFSYYQEDKVGLTRAKFLGDIASPDRLTRKFLNAMDSRCGRNSPVAKDFFRVIAYKLFFSKMDPVDIFPTTVAEVFLAPAGLESGAQVAYSEKTLDEMVSRNPQLANRTDKFVFPKPYLPYPVLNSAVLGPRVAAPFNVQDNDYMPIEFTPMYSGSPQYHQLQYEASNPKTGTSMTINLTVGGFVEPIAFGGHIKDMADDQEIPPPFFGLGPDKYSGILQNVPLPQNMFGLTNATAVSSFAPGSFLTGSALLKYLDNGIGLSINYWSPVTPSPVDPVFSTSIFVGDGASLENNGFLSLLRRGLNEIVVFVNSPVPLKPRSSYDPYSRDPLKNDIDVSFSCFFGYSASSVIENPTHNQVFPRHEFPKLVGRMQEAQKEGRGIVVRHNLETIENTYWGIPAGHNVTVTWVYLSRCTEWEKQLPKPVRELVVPRKNAADPSKLRTKGPFKYFPHIPTRVLHYTREQANLLANLAGWVVEQNKDLFVQALGSDKLASVA